MLQSAKKTGRVVIAHEAPLTNGFGAEIASTIQVNIFFTADISILNANDKECRSFRSVTSAAKTCIIYIPLNESYSVSKVI